MSAYLTTDFQNHLDKTISKSFEDYSQEAVKRSAFTRIFEVWDTDEYVESFTSQEWMDSPSYFDESEDIKNLTVWEGYKTTVTSREFWWNVKLPYKYRLRAKDDTTKLEKIAANRTSNTIQSMLNFVERQTHWMLNNWFTTQLAPDGAALFGTHTWKSTWTTFSNIPMWTKDLDDDAIDDVMAYWWAFVDANGQEMPIAFDTLVVKTWWAAAIQAKKLFAPKWSVVPETFWNINIYAGEYKIIETPYITSWTAYFLFDSMKDNSLFVNFTDRPHIESKVVDKNNQDWVYSAVASFKFWVNNMPFDWVGWLWTNA